MDELLTEEKQFETKEKILLIQRYEAGDESLLDEMIDILTDIYDYIKENNKIIRHYTLAILFSKLTSRLVYGNLDITPHLYELCDDTFAYYKESIRILKEYLDTGFKTNEFPDLEAAYLLTFYLTGLLYNINDYLKEIRSIENAYSKSYDYSGKTKIYTNCDERRGKVKSLVDAISPNNKHE